MWIVVFDFFLVLLLGTFFFYGINKWDSLIADTEEHTGEQLGIAVPNGRFTALWFLILGCGCISLLSDILQLVR